MGPIKERNLPLTILFGNGLICQKHKILDNPGCHILLICPDFHWSSHLIQIYLTFREIKVNGTSPGSVFSQQGRKIFHVMEQRNQLLILSAQFFITFQNTLHCCVSHSSIDADYRLSNCMADHFSAAVDVHQTAEGETIHSLIQGTNPIGKTGRQHGYDTVYQIYTGSSLQSLTIQGTSRLYIIADICNMYTQMINISFFGQRNTIIQILGIFPVNRHNRPVTKIHTPLKISFNHSIRYTFCLIHRFNRKIHREFIGPGNGKHINTGLSGFSQNFLNPSLRILVLSAVCGNFRHHLSSISSTLCMLLRNKNITLHFCIIGNNKSIILAFFKCSYHFCDSMSQNLNHNTFPAASVFLRLQTNLYPVLMKCIHGILFLDKNIFLLTFHLDKTKSPRVSYKCSLQQMLFFHFH